MTERFVRRGFILLMFGVLSTALPVRGQDRPQTERPYLSRLAATKDDPLYTTYAAPFSRSEFILDEGYHFTFNDLHGPRFSTDHAGEIALAFKRDHEFRYFLDQMDREPVVTASYSDLMKYRVRPWPDVDVDVFFQVYSSRIALLDVAVTNTGSQTVSLDIYPFLHHPHAIRSAAVEGPYATFRHAEAPDDWVKEHEIPHVTERSNVLLVERADAAGIYGRRGSNRREKDSFFGSLGEARLNGAATADSAAVVGFQRRLKLAPGATERFRVVRAVGEANQSADTLRARAEAMLRYDMDRALREAEARYARIPRLSFSDAGRELMYWSAFSLVHQVLLPPEGEASHRYYVFSREPTWGWGHGGQVFHESLSMLAYVFMDPEGALDSQRLFMQRQHEDGYINYRTGPYLNETIVTDGERTSSAPWFNWINAALYRQTKDSAFLAEAYASGARFYRWWLAERDQDGDGLLEWGGHAVLESVRDGLVAVWDEVGWPANFESLDLNVMMVAEAAALAEMAAALGRDDEADTWKEEVARRTAQLNRTFWDPDTGFFYSVDRIDHDFTFKTPGDLKRAEIVGLLPLWAGTATRDQAARLLEAVRDPARFGRPYGIPSLSASDPYYNPTGYWNGPVWVPWQYLLFLGLRGYGYDEDARVLAERVLNAVEHQLRTTHTFWEFYSPDHLWGGYHQAYNWTGLVARFLIDLDETIQSKGERVR